LKKSYIFHDILKKKKQEIYVEENLSIDCHDALKKYEKKTNYNLFVSLDDNNKRGYDRLKQK
jgi:hypothetical protein